MLTKNIENRNQVEFVSLEQMVPQDHLLRQIDTAIDFNKVYEFVEELYCKDNGRLPALTLLFCSKLCWFNISTAFVLCAEHWKKSIWIWRIGGLLDIRWTSRSHIFQRWAITSKHNFILGVHVTPGNIHDSVAFDSLYDDVCQHYPEHKIVAADSAYKTPWICKRIFESGRVLTSAYTRPKTKDGDHPWYTYVYDEYFDDVICPEYKALHYSTTNRNGYREYKSRSYLCADCPTKAMCTQNAKCEKTVTRHIWQRFVDMAEDIRHTPLYRDIYKLRQQKIERVFADAKEKHGMRYTQYRGLAQVTNWVKLKFAAMNLKKLATWKWKRKNPSPGKRRREIFSMDFLSALILFSFKMKKSVLAWCLNGLFLQAKPLFTA